MNTQNFPKALLLSSFALDLIILLIFLFMPRSGMEAMGAAFLLYPLVALRLIAAVTSLVLAWRRRHWWVPVYTFVAMAVLAWFWFVGASLSPSYEPLHRVLRNEARAAAVRFGDYLDQRAYDAKRARQHNDKPIHGELCDSLSVSRDHRTLTDELLQQDLDQPCATYHGDSVSPLLHAVIHTYGPWNGDIRMQPPVDEAFLGPAAERLLAAGADPDRQDEFGNTALHYALTFRNEGLLDALLAHGACLLIRNGLDESPLTSYSSHGLRKKVEAAAADPEALARCPESLRGLSPAGGQDAAEADARTPEAGLLSALRSGRLEQAIYYLEQGADPNASDREGSNFEAALRNCRDNALSLAQLLIDAGADINGQNSKGSSALMISMRYCVKAVPFLLDRGADPSLADRAGDTPLHTLGGVAPERLDSIVDALLAAGADINQQAGSGQTPLIRALFGGTSRARVMSALLSRGADLNLSDNGGNTPLHHLASRKRDDGAPVVMQQLLELGAKLELKNRKKETPLVTAVERGSIDASRVLVEAGADPNARRTRGSTLISSLISCKPIKIAKLELLLEAGAATDIPIEHGPLPLAQAFFGKQHLDCLTPAERLLAAGADPNQKDDNGAGAIHSIASWSEKDPDAALGLLVSSGADIDLKNQQGMTTLLYAARYGSSIRTMERLLAHGADAEARDNAGNTLLHAAAMNSKAGNLDRYDWVLSLGADPQAENDAGETPLDRARVTHNASLLTALEARQAD